jgi:hypothetical protein
VRDRALTPRTLLFGFIDMPNGALRALPCPSQLRCFPKNKKLTISGTKCFPSGPKSGRQGRIFFHWAKLHPPELHCTLQSYSASYLSYAAPYKLRCSLWMSFALLSVYIKQAVHGLLFSKSSACSLGLFYGFNALRTAGTAKHFQPPFPLDLSLQPKPASLRAMAFSD